MFHHPTDHQTPSNTCQSSVMKSLRAALGKDTSGVSGSCLLKPLISPGSLSSLYWGKSSGNNVGCIISAPSRNAIIQVWFNIVPSAHGGKKSYLLHHVVEDIYMKKSLSFYTIDLRTWLTFPYEGASIKNFSMILMPRGENVPFMFPFW